MKGDNIGRGNLWRIIIHFVNKMKQQLFGIGEAACINIEQDFGNQGFAIQASLFSKKYSRDRGVGFSSKRAIVTDGCKRGDELSHSRAKWARLA